MTGGPLYPEIRNIEALSSNNFYREKAVRITYSECESVA